MMAVEEELPEGWIELPLKDICEVKGGKRLPKGHKLVEEKTPYPYLTVADFGEDGTIEEGKIRYILKDTYEFIKKYTISSDDLYISIAGTIGKTGIVPEKFDGANLTENAAKFVIDSRYKINKKFLYYFTLSTTFLKRTNSSTRTVAQPKLALTRLREIKIPVPPLEEQKRIVAKLDAVFEKVDSSIEKLNRDFERINELIQSFFSDFFNMSKGLRTGWKHKTVEEISEKIQSGFACSKKNETPNGYVHLRTNNVGTNFKLNLSEIVKIKPKLVDVRRNKLNRGDILFNNTNSQELVGKTCLINEELNFAYSNHLTIIKLKDGVFPALVVYYFQYLHKTGFFSRLCKRWIGQAGINNTKLKDIEVPIPPIKEQNKMIAKMDSISQKREEIQTMLENSQLHNLKSSILDAAFRGKL